MGDRDVTALVEFGSNDGESLPLTKCLCGTTFPAWSMIIGIYRDWASVCPHCGKRFYFDIAIRVYECEAKEE